MQGELIKSLNIQFRFSTIRERVTISANRGLGPLSLFHNFLQPLLVGSLNQTRAQGQTREGVGMKTAEFSHTAR